MFKNSLAIQQAENVSRSMQLVNNQLQQIKTTQRGMDPKLMDTKILDILDKIISSVMTLSAAIINAENGN